MEITIDVRGSAFTRLDPERGVVRGTVTADGPQAQPVKDWVATAAARLREECTGKITVDQVRVTQHRPWNEQGEQLPLVHTATVAITAEYTDFEALGAWLLSEDLNVQQVDWKLTDETKAALDREVRQACLRDAVQRAQDYADTLALGPVRVRSIRDPDASPASRPRMMAMAAMQDAAGGIELSPEPIEINAEVHATFVVGSAS